MLFDVNIQEEFDWSTSVAVVLTLDPIGPGARQTNTR